MPVCTIKINLPFVIISKYKTAKSVFVFKMDYHSMTSQHHYEIDVTLSNNVPAVVFAHNIDFCIVKAS